MAKKMLANLLDMDLPAKTILWEGFRINAWQMGEELNGGYVMSPPGVVALCSKENVVQICTAESWEGSFLAPKSISIVDTGITDGQVSVINIPDPELEFNAVNKVIFQAEPPYRQRRAQPVAKPYDVREAVFLAVSVETAFEHFSAECIYTFYSWSGLQDQRTSIGWEQVSGDMIGKVIHLLPSRTFRSVAFNPWAFAPINSLPSAPYRMFEFWNIVSRTEVAYRAIGSDTIFQGIPAALSADIGTVAGGIWNQPINMGCYAHLIDGVTTVLSLTHANFYYEYADRPNYFWSSGSTEIWANRRWMMFFTIFTENAEGAYTLTTIGADQILPTLHAIAPRPVLYSGTVNNPWTGTFDLSNSAMKVNWDRAIGMMQTFLPSSGANYYTPPDSIAFHSPNGIFAWCRFFGAVKFSGLGLEAVSLNIPSEADDEGVQPHITYAGTVEGVETYLCVCQEVAGEVLAIYRGSPFGAWTALPMPAENTLVHVRPVRVSMTEVILLGVVKYTLERTGEAPRQVYKVAMLNRREEDTIPAGWRLMSTIPVDQVDGTEWNLSLFGQHAFVQDLCDYPSPPIAMPQTNWDSTYADYTYLYSSHF